MRSNKPSKNGSNCEMYDEESDQAYFERNCGKFQGYRLLGFIPAILGHHSQESGCAVQRDAETEKTATSWLTDQENHSAA
ncbi:hypothetical protein CDV31_016325 [Fusarium ambrosium]|uniref:Uncharacterized protein n=1 Tax=Fusarium ambrosium TaxID=131363 RepID=A0A428SB22_9HYPO|nr:hypothetical protein CDV31_016325 [Fusarium ambrosium]